MPTPETTHIPSKTDTPPATSHSRDVEQSRWAGTVLVALSAGGFASLTILAKIALDSGMSLTTILSLRFGGAALILAIFLRLLRRRKIYFGRQLTIILFLLGAIGYAGQSTLYFSALARNPASVTALLLYVYPIIVALLEWVFNRRPPTTRQWLAMGISSLGVVLIMGTAQPSIGSIDLLGVVFVLGSATWYAGYIFISSRHIQKAGPWVSTTWISLGAAFSFTFVGWIVGNLDYQLSIEAVGIVLAMIIFSTILALGTFLAGVDRVGPTRASLLSTLEPVFTVLLAVFLLGEQPTIPQIVGGMFILVAVTLLTLPTSPRRKNGIEGG